jgi:predicted dehydrogenase
MISTWFTDAVGRPIFSDNIDIANARIRFENGCVANITSSRISAKTERKLRIFQADHYLSIDLHNKSVSSYASKGDGPVTGPDDIVVDRLEFVDSDALLEQARAFLASVAGGPPPRASGRTGLYALETATIVGELVKKGGR